MISLVVSKKFVFRISQISLGVTLVLLLLNEVQTLIAWWVMLFCLLPALVWVQSSTYLSVKVFVWTVFVTQVVGVPLFYLNPEEYTFQSHRPYYFTGLEAFRVFYKVGIFLLVFLFVASLLKKMFDLLGAKKKNFSFESNTIKITDKTFTPILMASRTTSLISLGFIIFIICIMIPLNNWMFQNGIGLTGVDSPALPFRLSGILTYLAKILVPIVLAFLYLRTQRDSVIVIFILGFYSIFLGVSTVSKSAALIVILAPWAFALIDRRWFLFVITTIFVTLGIGLASASRILVYVFSENTSGSDTSMGVINTLIETARNLEWNRVWLTIFSIIGRIESFETLWLATNVNPDTFGGGLAVLAKAVDWNLVDLGHDAIHMEVLGYTVPVGIYNVPSGVLAYMLWAVGDSPLFYIPFAILLAGFLMLQELSIRVIGERYSVNALFLSPVIVLLSLSYYASIGYPTANWIFLFLVTFKFFPRLYLINKVLSRISASIK